jgi:hypothetical protein
VYLYCGYFFFDSNLIANVTNSLVPGTFINASLPIVDHHSFQGTSAESDVMKRIGTRDSCAIAVRFAVGAHAEKSVFCFKPLEMRRFLPLCRQGFTPLPSLAHREVE